MHKMQRDIKMPGYLLLSYSNYKIVAIARFKFELHTHRVNNTIIWCIFHLKRRALIEFHLSYIAFMVVTNVQLHFIYHLAAEIGSLQYAYFVLDIGLIS